MFYVNKITGETSVILPASNQIFEEEVGNIWDGQGIGKEPENNPDFIVLTGPTLYSILQTAKKDNPELTLEILAFYNNLDLLALNTSPQSNLTVKIPTGVFAMIKEQYEISKEEYKKPKTFTITKENNLEYYSKNYQISLKKLQNLNNFEGEQLEEGREIILSSTSHLIETGNTLYSIAQKYDVTIDDIIKINPELQKNAKGEYVINIGDIIVIPDKLEEDEKYDQNFVFKKEEGNYEVLPSDKSLYAIANKLNISIEDLKKFNDFDYDENGNPIIILGQIIKTKMPENITNKQEPAKAEVQPPQEKPETPKPDVPKPEVSKTDVPKPEKPFYTEQSLGIFTIGKDAKTLGGIAAKTGISVAKLKKWNNLTSDVVQPNQKIETTPPAVIYEIKQNDIFSKIAEKYGISTQQLRALNPDLKNVNNLKIGDKIIVPKIIGEMPDIEVVKKRKAMGYFEVTSQKPTSQTISPTQGKKATTIKNKQNFSAYRTALKTSIKDNLTNKEFKKDADLSTAIKEFEKFEKMPVKDCEGYWTVGYGHKLKSGEWDLYAKGITEEKALELLQSDLTETKRLLKSKMGKDENGKFYFDKLAQNQQDAVLDLVFNIGCAKLTGTNFLEALKKCDSTKPDYQAKVTEAAKHLDFNKGKHAGIYIRRAFCVLRFCDFKPDDTEMGYIMDLLGLGYNSASLKATYINNIKDRIKFHEENIVNNIAKK